MEHTNVDEGLEPYVTLAGEGAAELVVERSRFLAIARPIRTLSHAEALIDELRREHHDARHVCSAWRLGRGPQAIDRINDDGEPSKTGGYPLWQLLEGAQATDGVIAVVRYFGGVKLGMGGLARAYRDAGRMAMEAAGTEQRWPEVTRPLSVPWALHDRVVYLLDQLEGVRIERTEYAAEPTLVLAVRKVALGEVRQRLSGLLQVSEDGLLGS